MNYDTMSQTNQIISTLKYVLKEHHKTYKDIANDLGISEGSVKRTFADKSFTLDRIDRICNLIGLELSDLLQIMETRSQKLMELTLEQEHEIVSDLLLLQMTVLVLKIFKLGVGFDSRSLGLSDWC